MVLREWVGKRVEVDLVRPGPTFLGATHQGTLSTDARPETEERFYPWSAVLSVDHRSSI